MGIVAVTGVTGAVGRLAADALSYAGVPFRMLARSPERAPRYPNS